MRYLKLRGGKQHFLAFPTNSIKRSSFPCSLTSIAHYCRPMQPRTLSLSHSWSMYKIHAISSSNCFAQMSANLYRKFIKHKHKKLVWSCFHPPSSMLFSCGFSIHTSLNVVQSLQNISIWFHRNIAFISIARCHHLVPLEISITGALLLMEAAWEMENRVVSILRCKQIFLCVQAISRDESILDAW